MIYVLNIGYYSFAFPTMRGLQTVIETLSKAGPLKNCYFPGCEDNPERLEMEDRPREVCLHVVRGVSFVSGKTKREVIEPEVMPRRGDGEGDAVFALRASRALTCGSKKAVAGELRRMLREGGGE